MIFSRVMGKAGQFCNLTGRMSPLHSRMKRRSWALLHLQVVMGLCPTAHTLDAMIKPAISQTWLARIWLALLYKTCQQSEAFMQIDPTIFVSLIKQCIGNEETKQSLLDWLKLATLLNCQANGEAVSARLINVLTSEFPAILNTLARLDNNPVNSVLCQQLFMQISQFYTWLNTLSSKAADQIEQQWQSRFSGLPPDVPLSSPNQTSAQPADSEATALNTNSQIPYSTTICGPHAGEFNKYD